MGKTIKHKKDNKNLKEDKHKRREALMQMADVASAVNILSDKHLYKIPYNHIRKMSIGDMERLNKKWLKKIKLRNHMTKKEYKRWKNKLKKVGVA